MRWFRNPSPLPEVKDSPENHRRHGRIRTEQLSCGAGEVVDLSASGMRLQIAGRYPVEPGTQTSLTLRWAGGELPVQVRIVWVRKVGMRRFELGAEFLDESPEFRSRLNEIAKAALVNHVLAVSPP